MNISWREIKVTVACWNVLRTAVIVGRRVDAVAKGYSARIEIYFLSAFLIKGRLANSRQGVPHQVTWINDASWVLAENNTCPRLPLG